jgi:RHS repeat-associated protein
VNGLLTTSFYGFDGHGSVRQLLGGAGAVTDTYDYDAFGNLIGQTGSTPNNYLFAGEQFDPALGPYYNRARYLDVRNGRFWGMDPADAVTGDPSTLHRYLYVRADPLNSTDPTGLYTDQFGYAVERAVQQAYGKDFGLDPNLVLFGKWARIGQWSRSAPYSLKPDILDTRLFRGDGSLGRIWMEVKPLSISGLARAAAAYGAYSEAPVFSPDTQWLKNGRVLPVLDGGKEVATLVFNVGGILLYTTSDQDYDEFEDGIERLREVTGAIGLGGGAGLVVNLLARSLPRIATSPNAVSEVIDISTKARIAVNGSQVTTETEGSAEFLEDVI